MEIKNIAMGEKETFKNYLNSSPAMTKDRAGRDKELEPEREVEEWRRECDISA